MNLPSVARVRPLTTSPQALRLLQRRHSALMSAAAMRPCTLSPPTPTHTGDPNFPPVAANSRDLTVCVLGCAAAPAAAVNGLSAARKGYPSVVRFFISNPICTRTCMHLTTYSS